MFVLLSTILYSCLCISSYLVFPFSTHKEKRDQKTNSLNKLKCQKQLQKIFEILLTIKWFFQTFILILIVFKLFQPLYSHVYAMSSIFQKMVNKILYFPIFFCHIQYNALGYLTSWLSPSSRWDKHLFPLGYVLVGHSSNVI